MIVDTHEVIKNSSHYSISLSDTSCKAIVQYHSDDSDLDVTYQFYSDFLSFHLCVFVYLVLCNFITCGTLCIHHHSQV